MNQEFRCDCPVTSAIDILGDKWMLIIIKQMLIEGMETFKDFTDSDEAISTSILTLKLKCLESYGLVERKNHRTNKKTKLAACAKFKSLVETKKLILASKALISELKTFIALENSYKAKIGETDDLVMAMLLAVRMAVFLREFDPKLDEKLKDDSEEILMPMPFIII